MSQNMFNQTRGTKLCGEGYCLKNAVMTVLPPQNKS